MLKKHEVKAYRYKVVISGDVVENYSYVDEQFKKIKAEEEEETKKTYVMRVSFF